MQKTNVNKESMDVREVLDFFMRMPHKHSIWLWISWTTVSLLHCPAFSVGSPWNWFCEVEFYLFLDAADGIRDMFWIGCLPENKFVLLRPWSTLPTQWSEWIFPSVFLLATPVGLRNLQVCNFWNIFVSGVTFCFSCSQGSAFLPTAAGSTVFLVIIDTGRCFLHPEPCDTSFQPLRKCALLLCWVHLK